ncbi:MAG: hypothetical protein ACYS0K_09870, partial [Planctomycetota bacterium]
MNLLVGAAAAEGRGAFRLHVQLGLENVGVVEHEPETALLPRGLAALDRDVDPEIPGRPRHVLHVDVGLGLDLLEDLALAAVETHLRRSGARLAPDLDARRSAPAAARVHHADAQPDLATLGDVALDDQLVEVLADER